MFPFVEFLNCWLQRVQYNYNHGNKSLLNDFNPFHSLKIILALVEVKKRNIVRKNVPIVALDDL